MWAPRCQRPYVVPNWPGAIGHPSPDRQSASYRCLMPPVSYDPAAYGQQHAGIYDLLYPVHGKVPPTVRALAAAAGSGRVLELGVGTGRLAIPLACGGVSVDGIEASQAMIEVLRSRPGGRDVTVYQTDLVSFDLPHKSYAAAVCAASTLFMLPGSSAQQQCLTAVAGHLHPEGVLFVESFRPDPGRFDRSGRRWEIRSEDAGLRHEVASLHDPRKQTVRVTHTLTGREGRRNWTVEMHYASSEQLDEMAAGAGLVCIDRWHDWNGAPVAADSTDPISLYRRAWSQPG
ncbi:MAG: class I SAM-dependent methyltransferase [Mycobacteriales bacterium]